MDSFGELDMNHERQVLRTLHRHYGRDVDHIYGMDGERYTSLAQKLIEALVAGLHRFTVIATQKDQEDELEDQLKHARQVGGSAPVRSTS